MVNRFADYVNSFMHSSIKLGLTQLQGLGGGVWAGNARPNTPILIPTA